MQENKTGLKGCKHSKAWIMAHGYLWCPNCGSIRRFNEEKYEWKAWLRPIGDKTHKLYERISK